MNSKSNKMSILLVLIFFLLTFNGCAEIQKKAEYYWAKIKYQFSEKKTGSRQEAAKKYKGSQEKLILEQPKITPATVKPGQKLHQQLQYALICPEEEKKVSISEVIYIDTGRDKIELKNRKSLKAQGIYESSIEIVIPQDLDSGTYKIVTILSTEALKRTATGSFSISK